MSRTRRVRGLVTGLVQGVGFRYSMRREAEILSVNGWVRNLPDGRVEFEAQGATEAVDSMLAWVKVGPVYASVDAVDVEEREPSDDLEGFRITR